jgi:hypothetical protein
MAAMRLSSAEIHRARPGFSCRPWVIAAGVVMHLIDIGIIIGIFSYAMYALYLAWVPPGTVKRLPDTFKHATTKLLARLHRGRSDPTTDSAPGRAEVPELRPDEQVSTSEVVRGADAVNGFQHPRPMSAATFTYKPGYL